MRRLGSVPGVGHLLKSALVLSCALLMSAASASAQGGRVRILIVSSSRPADPASETAAMAGMLESLVADRIQNAYACADPVTMADVGALLTHDRDRALLDPSHESDFGAIAGALGAPYVVSLSATGLESGRASLNASVSDARSVRTLARETRMTEGGDAAVDSVGALANRIVQSLGGIRSLSHGCVDEWEGTIVYRKTTEHNENLQDDEEGVDITRQKEEYEATLTLRASPPNTATARVTASLTQDIQKIGTDPINCAARPGYQDPVWRTAKHERSERTDASLEATVEAQAEVAVSGNEARISFSIPEVEGGRIVWKRKVSDTTCTETLVQDIPDVVAPWAARQVWTMEVTTKVDPAHPDQLSGSQEVDGATIQWKLTRVRN